MLQLCEELKESVFENMLTEHIARWCKEICIFERHIKEQCRKTNQEHVKRPVHCDIYWCCVTGTGENWCEA
jgi:hypothetical protein